MAAEGIFVISHTGYKRGFSRGDNPRSLTPTLARGRLLPTPPPPLALAAAAGRTGGRYARVLPDTDADRAMAELEGVDFLVVDARRRDGAAVLAAARPGPRGMVVVRHGDGRRRGTKALEASMAAGTRIVRSVYLPIDTGVEVLHVGVGKGPSIQCRRSPRVSSRWIRHVDQETGEEHLFRRQ